MEEDAIFIRPVDCGLYRISTKVLPSWVATPAFWKYHEDSGKSERHPVCLTVLEVTNFSAE